MSDFSDEDEAIKDFLQPEIISSAWKSIQVQMSSKLFGDTKANYSIKTLNANNYTILMTRDFKSFWTQTLTPAEISVKIKELLPGIDSGSADIVLKIEELLRTGAEFKLKESDKVTLLLKSQTQHYTFKWKFELAHIADSDAIECIHAHVLRPIAAVSFALNENQNKLTRLVQNRETDLHEYLPVMQPSKRQRIDRERLDKKSFEKETIRKIREADADSDLINNVLSRLECLLVCEVVADVADSSQGSTVLLQSQATAASSAPAASHTNLFSIPSEVALEVAPSQESQQSSSSLKADAVFKIQKPSLVINKKEDEQPKKKQKKKLF